MNETLIVRYQMFCDDTSGDLRDESRVAELVCSLTSVKMYVAPFVNLNIIIYSLAEFMPRLKAVLDVFEFEEGSIVDIANPANEAFAATIEHCTPVDRICIRRMLADFSLLPNDRFRLLLGTDVIFQRPPDELFEFLEGTNEQKVLYMVDNESFGGDLYRLGHHFGDMLPGLLGDFYCLAPGVELSNEDIRSCLRMIDGWPTLGRWKPHPDWMPIDQTHACEQQAAAILLARFSSQELPRQRYRHVSRPSATNASFRAYFVLHAHAPWTLILKRALPKGLIAEVTANWRYLGMRRILLEASWPSAIFLILSRMLERAIRKGGYNFVARFRTKLK